MRFAVAPVLALLSLLAIVYPRATPAAERLDTVRLSEPGAFQSVTLATLLGIAQDNLQRIDTELPAAYRGRTSTSDTTGSVMWSRVDDWSRIRQGNRSTGKAGLFVSERSELVTWHGASGLFRDADGRDERDMHERFDRLKAKNVRIERIDRRGVPMLLVEADVKADERLRVIYVAAERRTRKIYYLPQRPDSPANALIWSRLRDGILDTPP